MNKTGQTNLSKRIILMAVLLFSSLSVNFSFAQSSKAYSLGEPTTDTIESFGQIYKAELGDWRACESNTSRKMAFCFDALKNEGNAPYILMPVTPARAVVVLFHGLSDSPYFVSSIAEYLRNKGYMVIAPLTPGHGKKEADADMQDEQLKQRWIKHVNEVMTFANGFDLPTVIGGFSTGGTLASYYTINNPDNVDALLLFSGALELGRAAEAMSKIWGMKTLATWLDGEYETMGPHPYKYPAVASYSGLVLLDLIHDVRDLLEEKTITKPIFAAHSMADKVTLFEGIEDISKQIKGEHTIFKIDESYDVCHADVPMGSAQIINLAFDKSQVKAHERCAVPKANPLHPQMLLMLTSFLNDRFDN